MHRTTQRFHLIDILRGFALIGILFANIPSLARIPYIDEAASRRMYHFIELGFEQRFFPIFSFLFGLGFFIFMQNADRKGESANWLMWRRLGLLFLMGLGHRLLQPGEALHIYAILGMLLFPLYRRSNRVIAVAFLATLIGAVFITEYFTVLAMFYLGLLLGKLNYFAELTRYRRSTTIVWILSLLLVGPLCWLQYTYRATLHFGTLSTLAGLSIATALVTSLILWSQTERILFPLAAFGRMALTHYILQTLIVLLLDKLFTIEYPHVPIIWLAIWPLQMVLSTVWLRYFRYGPFEWLWRWGTYGNLPQWRQAANPA